MQGDPLIWQTPELTEAAKACRYGAIVRTARIAHRLTLTQAGLLLGTSPSTLSRLERGQRRLADISELRYFADKLDIPLHLFGLAETGQRDGAAPSRHSRTADTVTGAVEGEDPVRRRELLATAAAAIPLGLLTRVDDAVAALPDPAAPASPVGLASRLATAQQQFDTGQLATLLTGLPDLLATAHELADLLAASAGAQPGRRGLCPGHPRPVQSRPLPLQPHDL